jgi:Delta3-Delta2-enoyl-CoA isomerase
VSADDQGPSLPSLHRDGDVFVLTLGDGENRFNADSLDAIEACLDEVQAAAAPRALVTTASGKIWSNGLDLDWMGANQEQIAAFVPRACSSSTCRPLRRCRGTRSQPARCSRSRTTSA